MSGKVVFILIFYLSLCAFKPGDPETRFYQEVCVLYNRMDVLFNKSNTSSATDSICMQGFKSVVERLLQLPSSNESDSLMYQSSYKLGVLYEIYKNYPGATICYIRALKYARHPTEVFRNTVLAGAGYYNLNNFDSASFFLLEAARTPDDAGTYEDRERLYNTLGVLYYDNGNYLQSKNYFTQALNLLRKNNWNAKTDEVTLELNIATCYYKLGMNKQALQLYTKIQNYRDLPDAFFMNIGKTQAGLKNFSQALIEFRKINVKHLPGAYNEMAKVAIGSGSLDSAAVWLIRYQKEKNSLHTNALDDGINALYYGELEILLGHAESALQHLQEALILFSSSFSEHDIHVNPKNFSGSFAYYRLFDVLVAKASAWELLFNQTKNPKILQFADDTYQSTISLLSYIERSYEMDDAKILLKQKSGEIYSKAISVCLKLNEFYPSHQYLESAFQISEKNKASVMRSQIQERNFLKTDLRQNEFEVQERNIKFNIARLNAKSEEQIDADDLTKINEEKSEYESKLVNLRKKMEGDRQFYQLKYADDFPSVRQLQEKLSSSQCLISINNEPDGIEFYILTHDEFNLVRLNNSGMIRQNIQSWISYLQNAENGKHGNLRQLKKALYNELVKPLLKYVENKNEWIIIPDGMFFMLPFESLPAQEPGTTLLEKYAISYEFSAGFIMRTQFIPLASGRNNNILSFAPFCHNAADLKKEGMGFFEKLPYSEDEIKNLSGKNFIDHSATKTSFVENINRYPIIHLATHAVSDLENPSASYIAFFPSGDRSEDFLFLDEIYSFRMDSCQMIVMSACETGRGEIVQNEGVMSFARAFLYSGCPSTINTLWKANDLSTATIMKSFYEYLEEGYSKPTALRLAKLDFIKKYPIYRDPSYWSHIIITGNPVALYKKKQPWLLAVLVIGFGAILIVGLKKSSKKRPTFSVSDIGS